MSTDLDTSFDDVFARDQKPEAPAETGPARDEQGRFAPKEATPPPVETTPAPEAKAEQPPAPDAQDTPPEGDERRIPLAELKAERAKRQAFEKQVEEIQRQNAELTRQMQEFMQRAQQPQQQPPQMQQEQMPDPWTDPQGAMAYQQRQMQVQMAHLNANMSERLARQQFGDQAVEAAQHAALQAGLGEQFLMRRDPYGDLMKWHRSTSFLQKVGNDPEAYEKSIEQKAYERALADLRSGKVTPSAAPGAPAPNTPAQRFPGSLASATATGAQGAVLTDEAIAASIFDSRRDRRA